MKKYKLEDLFELQMGKTPSRNSSDYWCEGVYDWISIKDLSNSEKYISETKEKLSKIAIEKSGIKPIPENTLVMSFKLSIGKVAITSSTMYSNEAIMAFHDKGVENILTEYLYYNFLSKDWSVGSNKAVMGITLNKATLSNVEINLHDIQEQERIVSILNICDRLISLKKDELEELDTLIKSRFVEMFGDPDKNPLGWVECALSKKINVIGGYAFKSEKFDENSGIPVLRIGNINTGYFKPVNLVYWKKDENLERYAIYPGDLVISLTGTVGKDDYGNVCILGNNYEMYYLNQRNAKLEILEGLDKYYLSQLLKFEQIKKKLTGISRGVRQANISNKDILDLVIPVPPIEIQKQYAKFIQQVDKSKFAIQKSIDETQKLFDSLMQEYFG